MFIFRRLASMALDYRRHMPKCRWRYLANFIGHEQKCCVMALATGHSHRIYSNSRAISQAARHLFPRQSASPETHKKRPGCTPGPRLDS
jgi:hypothetical protein